MVLIQEALPPKVVQEVIVPQSVQQTDSIDFGKARSFKAAHRQLVGMLAMAPKMPKAMGVPVGQLQEKWQFPSDHLPIGATVGDLEIASWNVLDSDYMDWVIEKNHQGLARSLIADAHIYLEEDSKLTARDLHTTYLVAEMLQHPEYPRDFVALQECNQAFIQKLRSRLPDHFEIIAYHGEAVVVDTRRFDVESVMAEEGIFSKSRERGVQHVTLSRKDTGEMVHVINAHLPGDPLHPARFEFARFLAEVHEEHADDLIIGLGDMNFNEVEMDLAVHLCYKKKQNPWKIITPYCTNISPYTFHSKAIDHFFIADPAKRPVKPVLNPSDLMNDLEKVFGLLNPKEG